MQKFKLFITKNTMLILGFIGLFLVSTGISLAAFTFLIGDDLNNPAIQGSSRIDLSKPKTETCPMNGMLYTKAERDIWENQRPLLAVIENHLDSRPQSGLTNADVVYEAVAEGGITRFLSVFYCGIVSNNFTIGQIRSARVYFIKYAQEYGNNPLFVHWGGANNICNDCPGRVKPKGDIDPRVDAYALLDKISWANGQYGNDLNGAANVGYPALFTDDRRMNLATEHQKVGSTDNIYKEAEKRGYSDKDSDGVSWDEGFVLWKFVDGKPQAPTATEISFEFWSNKPDYDVVWKYNQTDNNYLRFNGGKQHTDLESGEQISATNIVTMFVPEEGPVDKEHHLYYETTGEGKMILFQNGISINGTWEKASPVDRTIFYDEDAKEVSFVRGPIWIEVLPKGNTVNLN